MFGAYETIVGLIIAAIVVGGAAFGLYFMRLNNSKHMPDPVRKAINRRSIWMWAVLFSLWFILVLVMSYAEHANPGWSLTWRLSMYLVPTIFWVALLSFGLAKWVFDRRASGPTVLDVAAFPARTLPKWSALLSGTLPKWCALLLIACGVVVGVVGLITTFDETSAIMFWSVLLVAGGVLSLVEASSKIQICENGIWVYLGLLKWDKIKSYHWEGEPNCVLMFQTRSRVPFLRSGAIAIPEENKDAVDELLKEHCSSDA